MGRKPRIWYEGAIYHIINRGNNHQDIFLDEQDKLLFSRKLVEICIDHCCKIHAYCLLTSHYHLLFETSMTHISKTMHKLHTFYSKYFNAKYHKDGQLFQERYRSILVEKESYLLEVSRYIHLNPVNAGIVDFPENYDYSSLKAYLGKLSSLPILVYTDSILDYFSSSSDEGRPDYLKYVHNKLDKKYSLEPYITDDDILGSESFIKEIKTRYR